MVALAAFAQLPQLDTGKWKTFFSKAGWRIKYPESWQVASCDSCPNPTDANVVVDLYNPATTDKITVEPLDDKPAATAADQWLTDVSKRIADARVSDQWITLNGTRALRVINSEPNGGQAEHIYVLNGAKTFTLRTAWQTDSQQLLQQIILTFRF